MTNQARILMCAAAALLVAGTMAAACMCTSGNDRGQSGNSVLKIAVLLKSD